METFWAERGLGSRWELLKTVESRGFASPCLILAMLLGFVVGLPNPTHTRAATLRDPLGLEGLGELREPRAPQLY